MRIEFVEQTDPPRVQVVEVLAEFSAENMDVNREAAQMFAETYDKSLSAITNSRTPLVRDGTLADDALLLDGLDECIALVTTNGAPVYDYDRLVDAFMGQGMDRPDAQEWIDFNVLGLHGNGKFHIAYNPHSND